MPTLEEFEQEIISQAQSAGVTPDEYIRICQDFLEKIAKTAPKTLQQIASSDNRFQEAEKRIEGKIAMGARRTYGSF